MRACRGCGADLPRGLGSMRSEDPCGAFDDRRQRGDVVEVEPQGDAEAAVERLGQEARRVVAPTSVKGSRSTFIVRAIGPSPIITSRRKSSIAG